MDPHDIDPGQAHIRPVHPLRSAAILTVAYGVVGLVWVSFSDHALFALVSNEATIARLSAAKGELFVIATSVLLFAVSFGYLRLLERSERRYQLQERSKDLALRQGYVDVLDAVTGGKLILLTKEEMTGLLGEVVVPARPLERKEDLGEARGVVREQLEAAGIADMELALVALSEALTNALKHGRECRYEVRRVPGAVQLVVSDEGPGIDFRSLPKAALVPGYSTTNTLGMGFTIMLDVSSRLLLCTDSRGTTLVLELPLAAHHGSAGDVPLKQW